MARKKNLDVYNRVFKLYSVYVLTDDDILNYGELCKLKEDLTEYINKVNYAIANISRKEINDKNKEKAQLKKEYNKQIEKLNKEIEVLLSKLQ